MSAKESTQILRGRIVEWVREHGQPKDKQVLWLLRESSDGGSVAVERIHYDQENSRWRGHGEQGIFTALDGSEQSWIIYPARFCLCQQGWIENQHPVGSEEFNKTNNAAGGKICTVTVEIAGPYCESL